MASSPLGVVACLESPKSPHCLDWVSIPNTSERPAIYGCPIPPPGQPDSTWAEDHMAGSLLPLYHPVLGPGHTSHISYPADWAVAYQFSWLFPGEE